MADESADTPDADGAAIGVPTGPADLTTPPDPPPPVPTDEQSARRGEAGKPGEDSGKHYEPL